MADMNLNGILDQAGGAALIEEYLDTSPIARRSWETPLVNVASAQARPLPGKVGQYTKYTRKGRFRRPQNLATPGGAGSDPLSGVTPTVDQTIIPIVYFQDYAQIATVASDTSWLDLDNWVKEDLPVARMRRFHELVQNAFIVGRMTPGVYAADGSASTTFDASAQTTPTLYGVGFTFKSAPKYYAGGVATFADLVSGGNKLTWADIRSAHTKLGFAGARKVGGNYVCCLSDSMWEDLLADDDNGRLTAAISGSLEKQIKGFEQFSTFVWAGTMFVIDEQPFTEATDAEGVRADYGPIHSALYFGAEAFGYMPLAGKNASRTKFKVQDISKTGHELTIGYLTPWQVAVINEDWCAVIKGFVTTDKPNNFDIADPGKQLEGFSVDASA